MTALVSSMKLATFSTFERTRAGPNTIAWRINEKKEETGNGRGERKTKECERMVRERKSWKESE